MNSSAAKISRKITLGSLVAFASLASSEASLVKMGFQKDKMPVDVESVLHTFDRARRLQFFEMRNLQTNTVGEAHAHPHPHDEEHMHKEFDFEDSFVEIETTTKVNGSTAEEETHSEKVEEFVEMQEEIHSSVNATAEKNDNNTIEWSNEFWEMESTNSNATATNETTGAAAAEEDESVFFKVEDQAQDLTTVAVSEPIAAEFASDTEKAVVAEEIVVGRTSVETGPRGGTADISPKIEPTEISFMIVMDDFSYSDEVETLEDITIGTKFAFTGRIVTQAEELGDASGVCTVTSAIKTELSYCDIYHKIDTDNFGGFGSVVVSGTADEVGGRLLVTGTGGSLQSTHKGYAMVQFDPAGNPVLYVLLKLF